MLRVDPLAVYGLWIRDLLRFRRSRSRVIGAFLTPLLVFAFFGFGFRGVQFGGVPGDVSYVEYLVPGILGFTMLFSASFTGLAVLSDREVGFLKEILVAPVPRTSIVLGRVLGGATTALIQTGLILAGTVVLGFRPRLLGLPLAAVMLVAIAVTFIGFGLALATLFSDTQGYNLLVNFTLFPLAFLSGAFYPLSNLPTVVQYLGYLNPLTYGIDGLRGALVGYSQYPLWLDFGVVALSGVVMVTVGAAAFGRFEVD
ncbi:ABC transporter permease [Halorarius halobius]|uniref:ABC transporter permease n=1 Tax=Halorarius halobius TaxID=2962671 RepID=UPI0020CD3D58|nr:ABC transporter permease [Halorarius halobius]